MKVHRNHCELCGRHLVTGDKIVTFPGGYLVHKRCWDRACKLAGRPNPLKGR